MNDENRIETVLLNTITQMKQGNSLKQVLIYYPEEAAQVRPLAELAQDIMALPRHSMRPETLTTLKARLITQLPTNNNAIVPAIIPIDINSKKRVVTSTAKTDKFSWSGLFNKAQTAIIAASLLLIMTVTVFGAGIGLEIQSPRFEITGTIQDVQVDTLTLKDQKITYTETTIIRYGVLEVGKAAYVEGVIADNGTKFALEVHILNANKTFEDTTPSPSPVENTLPVVVVPQPTTVLLPEPSPTDTTVTTTVPTTATTVVTSNKGQPIAPIKTATSKPVTVKTPVPTKVVPVQTTRPESEASTKKPIGTTDSEDDNATDKPRNIDTPKVTETEKATEYTKPLTTETPKPSVTTRTTTTTPRTTSTIKGAGTPKPTTR